MSKRFSDLYQKFVYKNQSTPFNLGTFTVVALCLLALVTATFTQLEIIHPWFVKNPDSTTNFAMKTYTYIPQIPVLLGIVALLGSRFSTFTVILYILMGFFIWPVFALGGGIG